MVKAICPKNPAHKQFYTTVRVDMDWLVDENGSFIESGDLVEVLRAPNITSGWECAVCKAEAVVTEDEVKVNYLTLPPAPRRG